MDLRLQPKPEIDIEPADKGIVSRENFFVKKVIEEINQYFYPAHLVRDWKPKAELIYSSVSDETTIQYECDFNRDVQNCFVEDYAEEVFLRTPPPCFVVLGKFGANVTNLSKEIAREYGSVLIQVEDVVNQVVNTDSETGNILKKLLRLGISLTLNFILALLSFVAHTAEARHRGYVLCGLPCIPFMHDLSVEQQLDYLFCWENKPTVFIYVLFEDEDLIGARSSARYEIQNSSENKTYLHLHDLPLEETAESEDESNEKHEESNCTESYFSESDLNISPSRPWVKLPRDEESQLCSELELFGNVIKPTIDLLISRVDPQYFITVDSRVPNEFEVVKARLSLMQISKVPVPFPFIPVKETAKPEEDNDGDRNTLEETEENDTDNLDEILNEEDAELVRVAQETPQNAFLTLFSKRTLSPKFRWELSHYNYICPVSLRDGEVIEGKSQFAAVFMKYIFFLRNEEALRTFLKNPRPFVLPVRPKPPTRFFVIGYPYCGKTTLAQSLSEEFAIPIINLTKTLSNDLERKKSVYREFCREKAECREVIRLTALAWKDWRSEEEQRISIIEEWIEFIQTLLVQRIQQFYSEKTGDDSENKSQSNSSNSGDYSLVKAESPASELSENERVPLQVQGISIETRTSHGTQESEMPGNESSPSAKIIQALKHEDFDFDKKGLEVEANLFFSALWSNFAGEDESSARKKTTSEEKKDDGEDASNKSIAGEELYETFPVNWCSLLPPQSLSSFLLKKKPHTMKEKRKSFQTLLSAASKAYWKPSSLKTEFVKWRLPCFMDIPLCELLLNDPILLYKYCPEWLKHRPPLPEPVDRKHYAVVEAGRKAYNHSDTVSIQHSKEEVGILLKNDIRKAEKDGVRITGDIISPGGWVVDNMVVDLHIWCFLAKSNVFPTHVYSLVDSEPEFRRIVNYWYDIYHESSLMFTTSVSELVKPEDNDDDSTEIKTKNNLDFSGSTSFQILQEGKRGKTDETETKTSSRADIINLLRESCAIIAKGEEEIDDLFEILISDGNHTEEFSVRSYLVDPFSHYLLSDKIQTSCDFEEIQNNEATLVTVNFSNHSGRALFSSHQTSTSVHDLPLGAHLQIFTSRVINALQKFLSFEYELPQKKKCYQEGVKFFVFLLTLSQKLEELKEWLLSLNRGIQFKEIDVFGKTSQQIFSDVIKELYLPFNKKPRELESFEVEEIDRAMKLEEELKIRETDADIITENNENNKSSNAFPTENYEDVRIYGESGPFCIVNLERNILLKGDPKYALRYYGKLYFFWNETCKSAFVEDPEKYAPYYSPIRSLPPLRIFVLGPMGGEKSLLASSISNQCGIHYVDYIQFLNKKLIPHVDSSPNKLSALNEPVLLTESHNKEAKRALAEFLNASYTKRKFWLENPPFYSETWNLKDPMNDLLQLKDIPVNLDGIKLEYQSIEADPDRRTKNTSSESLESTQNSDHLFMKDTVEVIENYIRGNSNLTRYCVNKSLKVLWDSALYATEGFVIKDFPLRSYDVQLITENNWIPDVFIEVNLTEEEAVERNVDRLMDVWDTKLKQEMVEEQLLEDTVRTIQDMKAMLRRIQLWTEKHGSSYTMSDSLKQSFSKFGSMRRFQESQDKVHGDKSLSDGRKSSLKVIGEVPANSVSIIVKTVQSQLEAEIDEMIRQEFPPLEFNPRFETYDEGKARILNNFVENHRRDASEISNIKLQLQKFPVPWIEINNASDLNEIFIRLNGFKKRLDQRGEFAFAVSMETAERLLEQGYYFLSKFGRFCPVQAFRKKNPINMFRPLNSKNKIIPVAYRNYIYFIGGENEKVKFIQDPLKYIFDEPHHPNIPLRVAVIGPPKSGKSILCKRLSIMFGLKVITMGSAIRFVLENMTNSTLKKTIDGYLRRGCFLPLSLKAKALAACLNDPSCVTQGYVFDGIPFDAAMAQSLAEKKVLPFVIISLTAESLSGKINRQNLDLNEFRLKYKQRINLDTRYAEWKGTYRRFVQWNRVTYNNVYEINADSGIVDIFYRAYDIIKKSFFNILDYVEYCITDKVLSLEYLCISQQEFELRKSNMHDNCPVCWVDAQRLKPPEECNSRQGLVQYMNYYYWVCSDHKDMFFKNPKKYLPPYCPDWPTSLPKRLTKNALETAFAKIPIHGNGRCPVTRMDFPESLDWEGSRYNAAFYEGKVYLCKNKDMLDRFLARPWRYHSADTTFEKNRHTKSRAVEELGPPTVTSLPPIGFLEQTVANLIHRGLQVLGSVRPVYPNLSPACTGNIFLGLFLKVHNKHRKADDLEKEYLDFMTQFCKAYRFQVPFAVKRNMEEGQGDDESNFSDSINTESEASQVSLSSGEKANPAGASDDLFWLDVESQADKKLWSAKYQSSQFAEMMFTINNELQEISEVPKVQVILKYEKMRSLPLPPIKNCLNYIYSRKPGLVLPEPFNVNFLYQPPLSESNPTALTFNPDRKFSHKLYSEPETLTNLPSDPNLWQGKRADSDSVEDDNFQSKEPIDSASALMEKLFFPRIQPLDVCLPAGTPSIPRVIEEVPLIFEPQREYTYTMLLSNFFQTSSVLKCYEWRESKQLLELTNLFQRNLGLCNARSQFLHKPRRRSSEKSVRSKESYQRNFDAANTFFCRNENFNTESSVEVSEGSSLITYIQQLIFEKLNKAFSRLSLSDLSYDSYETNIVSTASEATLVKPVVMIREILPFPPLIWDIISRPYYSFRSVPVIFKAPDLDSIAHERHVSLLDGIMEPNDRFQFVRYPTYVREIPIPPKTMESEAQRQRICTSTSDDRFSKIFFNYDFFNIGWTAFLPHPFSWSRDADLKTNIRGPDPDTS